MSKYYIGVDIGGTKILASVVNIKKGEVIASEKALIQADNEIKDFINNIISVITGSIKKSNIKKNNIKAIGIGMPGIIDKKNGIILSSPNLSMAVNFNIKKELKKKLKYPIVFENDVNAGTIAEFSFGAAKNIKNGLCIFIGTGIGGGIMINKSLFTGKNGFAGELGHIIIDASSNKICKCGSKGCFEALASRTSLSENIILKAKNNPNSIIKKLSNNFTKPIKSSLIKEAFLAEDNDVKEALEEQCHYIGIACANYINIFNPESIVIGGGLIAKLGDIMIERINNFAKNYSFKESFLNCKIVKAYFGDFSGVVGAALLAKEAT